MGVTPPDEFDVRVIRRAQRGHRGSRAVLLRDLQDVWYRFSYKMLNDADSAREATQETGLRFLQHLPQFRGDSQLKTGGAAPTWRWPTRGRWRRPSITTSAWNKRKT